METMLCLKSDSIISLNNSKETNIQLFRMIKSFRDEINSDLVFMLNLKSSLRLSFKFFLSQLVSFLLEY